MEISADFILKYHKLGLEIRDIYFLWKTKDEELPVNTIPGDQWVHFVKRIIENDTKSVNSETKQVKNK